VKSTQALLAPTAMEGWLLPETLEMVRTSPNVAPPSVLRATMILVEGDGFPNLVRNRFPN
jgi:hypothetical protein